VIDLSGVEMIDAAGLGALISVASRAQASQCSVKLAAPGNLIRQLLELTKLTSVFKIHPTLDAATRIPWTSGVTDPTRITLAQ
jgi:anti-sigma B factor antagonist